MTYYRILRAGAERDGVPAHEHDGTDLSGEAVFLVLRADRIYAGVLEVVDIISEDWNGANPPDLSGGSQDPTATAGYALDSSGGAAQFNGDVFLHQNSVLFVGGSLNATGTLFANAFTQGVDGWRLNPTGSVEFYDPVFVGDHSAASPSVRRLGTADGQFFGSGFVGLAIGGAEVARFNSEGISTAARGTLGYAEVTVDQGSITTEVDLTNLAVTVTVGTSRRIRIHGHSLFAGGTGTLEFRIKEGATQLGQANMDTPGTNSETIDVWAVETPSAGEHTYKLTAAITTGTTGTITDATFPAFILVEDIGPA